MRRCALLHTSLAFRKCVKGTFHALHARTLSHATENVGKVRQAFLEAVGESEITTNQTEGHHGNMILVLEATVEDDASIRHFFDKLSTNDLETIIRTLPSRIDDGCNLFIRLDKQLAFAGKIQLGQNDDVISIRLRVRSFPAKPELASKKVQEYIEAILHERS